LTYVLTGAAARLLDTSVGSSATVLFVKGVAPTLLAVAVAVGIVLPAFLLFEPRHDGERAGMVLIGFALIGFLRLAGTIHRAACMLSGSRSMTTRWRATASPLDTRWGIPAFSIDAGFPVVAISGLFRPRLFVDRRVLAVCSSEELDAIAAHERAHVVRHDNLRRLLIGACHGPASATAAAWRQAAERAADAHAASSPRQAVHLASALLKIARLPAARTLERTVLSTIHDGGSLEARVRHLIAVQPTVHAEQPLPTSAVLVPLLPAAAALGLNWSALLRSAHALTEAAVRHLP
jgi:hypothetical protein